MDFLLSAVGGLASGGVLSLVSTIVKGIGGFMKRKQEAAQRDREWQREMELENLRMERGDRETENEVKIAQSEGSWRGLAASYNTVIAPAHVHKWVNDVRSLFRLVLTLFMLVMVWYMFSQMMNVLKGSEAALSAAFTPEEAGEMVRYIVMSVVYTGMTTVAWWYGDRALSPSTGKAR